MPPEVRNSDHQDAILKLSDIYISYETRKGDVPAVRGVSMDVHRGKTVGLVGESGCGKSTIAYGIVDFLGANGKIVQGDIAFQEKNLVGLPSEQLRQIRGNQIAMVYQDPMQALNPSLRVGNQLAEALIFHQELTKKEAWDRSIEMLKRVYMPDPANVMNRYPHQISGGQQQRIVIAMALLNNPALLIMDEPTTALDVTVEAVVLDLIEDLKKDFDTGILYITHNLGVVARISDSISVMYAGELVEQGTAQEIFDHPLHPYTQGLMRCVPKLGLSKETSMLYPIRSHVPPPADRPTDECIYASRCDYAIGECRFQRPDLGEIIKGHRVRCIRAERIDRHTWRPPSETINLQPGLAPPELEFNSVLNVNDLKAYYRQESKSVLGLLGLEKKKFIKAVDDVTLGATTGRTLGIVGESGCGKTTLAKAIIGLEEIRSGKAEFLGVDINMRLLDRSLSLIKELQMVFQNPDSTLNPSYSVGKQIARPLKRFKIVPDGQISNRVIELLRAVQLEEYYYDRLPRQLSGGEKQRVGIARALASEPNLIICDEPVSALDVSVQASILNLLMELQNKLGTTIIFIAHDLSVVRFLSDDVAVMYLGKVMEFGSSEAIYAPPYHPYTEALLSAVPIPDPGVQQRRIRLVGDIPSASNPPTGCPFHTRCHRRHLAPDKGKICEKESPPWQHVMATHRIFCHIPLDVLAEVESVVTAA
jgi:peptide/nickel transport system ATP-binding protein